MDQKRKSNEHPQPLSPPLSNLQDRRAVFEERIKNPAPKVEFHPKTEKTLRPKGDGNQFNMKMMDAVGTVDPDLRNYLITQLLNSSPWGENLNAALAAVHGISPNDELEGLLAVQMASAHNLAMEFMRRSMLPNQTCEGIDANVNRAAKLLRAFTMQVEALGKYRTKGHQTIAVQHIQVNGPTVVGNVYRPKKKGGTP